MAVSWGGTSGSNAQRVGIDVIASANDGVGSSYTVTVDYYVHSTHNVSDNQTLTLSGSLAGTYNYNISGAGATLHVARQSFIAHTSYGGGPVYTFSAGVSGHYGGATPGHTVQWALPARRAEVPGPPGVGIDSITATSARVVVSAADGRGSVITGYQTLIGTSNEIIATQIYNHTGAGTNTPTILKPATNYYVAVRAKSNVGDGEWGFAIFRTAPTIPGAPSRPTVSKVEPDSATIAWAAPSSNGGAPITRYTLQTATDSGFTTNRVGTYHTSTSATRTDLAPGTVYYARVQAWNSAGYGVWGPTTSFETLSGMRLKVNNSWRSTKVWTKVNGAWKVARVHKKVNGAWRL